MVTGTQKQLDADYQEWLQRLQDTCDAVRYTYGCRDGGDPDFAEMLGVHVILQMLGKPNVFRYHGMPFSARIGNLAGPFLNRESDRSELTLAVSWTAVKTYLEACPEHLKAAVVCSFIHGDSIEAMSERLRWSVDKSTRLRAEAAAYLGRAGIPADGSALRASPIAD
ncbi:hypothetical protein [Mycobacterium sp. AT1]|uniref:hypothetical protein n=1 Tax=Mycobacterium sp. AT1 TaxID=1961706 RepID=UPI0009AD4FF1|nr:hypothetical protein [Mycobacterium sp. AT1]OPX05900.1 hypothetical protein B1790_29990 [Mycobacterium sp. AT1]